MMAQLPITPPRNDRSVPTDGQADSLNLVAVVSESPHEAIGRLASTVSVRLRGFANDSRRVRYTRVAAHTVGGSAAWLLRRTGKTGLCAMTAGLFGMAPEELSDLPRDVPAIMNLLLREESSGLVHRAVATAIAALRTADAVIAGQLSADDANVPGLVPHLADLACRAYRALRPPREPIVHPGFAQVARRFQFIQMCHRDARSLGAGAIDIGILAHRLRQLQGDGGEFAITAFNGHGLLWADNRSWEIDPLSGKDVDEERAGATFRAAWVVARRFLDAPASRALAYAHSAAAATVNPVLKNRTRLPLE